MREREWLCALEDVCLHAYVRRGSGEYAFTQQPSCKPVHSEKHLQDTGACTGAGGITGARGHVQADFQLQQFQGFTPVS